MGLELQDRLEFTAPDFISLKLDTEAIYWSSRIVRGEKHS